MRIALSVTVPLISRVRATVDLHDKARLDTAEVGEVRPDWMLATKPETGELPLAQVSPQHALWS
jgi:hypothetical protein